MENAVVEIAIKAVRNYGLWGLVAVLIIYLIISGKVKFSLSIFSSNKEDED